MVRNDGASSVALRKRLLRRQGAFIEHAFSVATRRNLLQLRGASLMASLTQSQTAAIAGEFQISSPCGLSTRHGAHRSFPVDGAAAAAGVEFLIVHQNMLLFASTSYPQITN